MPWMSMYQRKRKIRKQWILQRTQKSQWTALQMNHQRGGKNRRNKCYGSDQQRIFTRPTNNKDSTQTVEQTSAGNKDSTESSSNAGASPSKATKPGTGTDDNTQTGKGSTQADKSEDNAAGVPTNKSHVPTATVGGSGKG